MFCFLAAYSVLRTEEPLPGLRLLNIRNPWGQLEWKGKYADSSKDWTPELKKKLGIENSKFEGSFESTLFIFQI